MSQLISTSTSQNATFDQTDAKIVVASDGTALALYYDGTSMVFRSAASPYTSWSSATTLPNSGSNKYNAGVWLNADDSVDVAYHSTTGTVLYVKLTKSGSSWSAGSSSTVTTNGGGGASGEALWIGRDTQATPHIWVVVPQSTTTWGAYYSTDGTTWTASITGAAVGGGSVTAQPAAAISGKYLLVTYSKNNGQLAWRRLDVSGTLTAWTAEQVVNLGTNPDFYAGDFMSLATDGNGRIIFVMSSQTFNFGTGVWAKVYTPSTDTWGSDTHLGTQGGGVNPDNMGFAVSNGTDVWVFYSHSPTNAANSNQILYKKWSNSGATWDSSATSLEGTAAANFYPNAGYGHNTLAIMFTQGTASPYNVYLDTVSLTGHATHTATGVVARLTKHVTHTATGLTTQTKQHVAHISNGATAQVKKHTTHIATGVAAQLPGGPGHQTHTATGVVAQIHNAKVVHTASGVVARIKQHATHTASGATAALTRHITHTATGASANLKAHLSHVAVGVASQLKQHTTHSAPGVTAQVQTSAVHRTHTARVVSAQIARIPPLYPVISRSQPAYASDITYPPSNANDADYGTLWITANVPSVAAPQYWAVDLSGVPAANRHAVALAWYNETADGYWVTSGNINNQPRDYTVEVNAAAGGSLPTTGWVTVATVTGNVYWTREHKFDLTGYNWVRLRVTASNAGSAGGGLSLQIDVHDAHLGDYDDWLILGDSITAEAWFRRNIDGSAWGFGGPVGAQVNVSNPAYLPLIIDGGYGGQTMTWGAQNIASLLAPFSGRYVGIAYGTNDLNLGFQANAAKIASVYADLLTIVDAVLAAGMVPVVALMPFGTNGGGALGINALLLNTYIRRHLPVERPRAILGPDLWTPFWIRQDLIRDGIHPTYDETLNPGQYTGYDLHHRTWRDWLLANIYGTPHVGHVAAGVTAQLAVAGGKTHVYHTASGIRAQLDNPNVQHLAGGVTAQIGSHRVHTASGVTAQLKKHTSHTASAVTAQVQAAFVHQTHTATAAQAQLRTHVSHVGVGVTARVRQHVAHTAVGAQAQVRQHTLHTATGVVGRVRVHNTHIAVGLGASISTHVVHVASGLQALLPAVHRTHTAAGVVAQVSLHVAHVASGVAAQIGSHRAHVAVGVQTQVFALATHVATGVTAQLVTAYPKTPAMVTFYVPDGTYRFLVER